MEGLRLNKALALAGLCSRRKADALIEAGCVQVNGRTVTELGLRVDPGGDTVTVQGKRISVARADARHDYVLLNKPIQVVTTAHDPEGRTTVLDLLPGHLQAKRLYPVGRLDYFSEGLLLLTNDGELTNRLTHPRHHLPKVYEVTVRETPGREAFARMRSGMTLKEGERLAPVDVQHAQSSRNSFLMTLRQGVNRQIRRMCRDLGLTILRLRRVAIGPVELGELPEGSCRELAPEELKALRRAVGPG